MNDRPSTAVNPAGTVAGTSPYPWPWDGRLSAGRTALLVVTAPTNPGDSRDLQEELVDAAGALREQGVAVVEVRGRPPLSARGAGGTTRAAVSIVDADVRVDPVGWDGFHGSPLDGWLRAAGRDQLLLCGWWLEVGVHSTMRSANDRGYECLLVADLCAAADHRTERGAISSTEMSGGIFGAVGRREDVLTAYHAKERMR